MAEVVVDQTPRPQLPYDPNDIPEAVRKRAAQIDALYANGSQNTPSVEPEQVQLQLPLAEPTPQPPPVDQPSATAAADVRPTDPEEQSWHHRFLAMQGRYNASQKTIGELQEQMTQLGNELVHTQHQTARQPAPPPPQQIPRYITEQDVQDYGSDLVNFTQRAAADAVVPRIMEIERQNQELQLRLAQEARARLDMRVEAAIPNFREIDRDPRWHRWLLGIDMLSGRVRQTLLDEAIAAADAPRAISFFRGFLQEEVATGNLEPAYNSQQPAAPREAAVQLASLAAPGKARPASGGDISGGLPESRVYTRAQIKQLYDAHRRGAYVGREAEWARQDADIIRAGAEGRVR